MITHHTELLNALIEKYNLKSYLEIGVQNPANNFDKIKCEDKHGVDPDPVCGERDDITVESSDQFFNFDPNEYIPPMVWDLIFIDGLHHADQVKRDFENSLRCLSDNGFIVIHDVFPENEAGTRVPRETKQWWGDVYKFAMTVQNYDGIGVKTFNIDNGCMVVWKSPGAIGFPIECNTDWESYLTYGKTFMNVTSTVEI